MLQLPGVIGVWLLLFGVCLGIALVMFDYFLWNVLEHPPNGPQSNREQPQPQRATPKQFERIQNVDPSNLWTHLMLNDTNASFLRICSLFTVVASALIPQDYMLATTSNSDLHKLRTDLSNSTALFGILRL